MKPYSIHADWDDQAQVWVATSEDLPGLATEADTQEQLIANLKTLIPELLDANGVDADAEVRFELLTRILLLKPSTKPSETLFSGLQQAAMPSQCRSII